ncbi:sensor histidine kinase [Clostridium sp. SHJSY1]|uniref:sensor histidine kinase n=1 Tax=Clostridium sp. SHJSY1 TaxID=2942483 RepID=UPI002875B937|nr:sensor histidine kinase [Clostridium sp. SHJSY1]MDS0524460.1 sensor histidine kinase [Clostridium sp. SHJSY1]
MKLRLFFIERIGFIIANILIIAFIILLLNGLKVDTYAIILISCLVFLLNISLLIYEYLSKSSFIKKLNINMDNLNEKYLISEIISEPNKDEHIAIYNILKECNKSMNDKIAEIELENKDYMEFIELWIHEVKTPIASTKLLIENYRTPTLNSIEEDINKVEEYIEQALFYARSSAVEKDFIIKKLNLEEMVNSVIKKNSKTLIEKSIRIQKDNLKNHEIYSDKKWIEFILHQIISNSIKYFDKKFKVLNFSVEEQENSLVLHIKDNGLGMSEKSVIKAFDKGYTGENGRIFKEATGIGLYLCKKLCNKLGLGIYITSTLGEMTKVSIVFPKNKMMILED